jgi:hypothetical protein
MSKLAFDAILARLDALERKILGHARRRVSRTEKARLEGVSVRTIARRVADGIEGGERINGRWYFWVNEGAPDTAAAKAARNPRLRKAAQPEAP